MTLLNDMFDSTLLGVGARKSNRVPGWIISEMASEAVEKAKMQCSPK